MTKTAKTPGRRPDTKKSASTRLKQSDDVPEKKSVSTAAEFMLEITTEILGFRNAILQQLNLIEPHVRLNKGYPQVFAEVFTTFQLINFFPKV